MSNPYERGKDYQGGPGSDLYHDTSFNCHLTVIYLRSITSEKAGRDWPCTRKSPDGENDDRAATVLMYDEHIHDGRKVLVLVIGVFRTPYWVPLLISATLDLVEVEFSSVICCCKIEHACFVRSAD